MMTTTIRTFAAALLLAACWLVPARAHAQGAPGSLVAALEELSDDIANYLKEEEDKKLRMGDFRSPPDVASDRGGNAIEDALTTRLQERGLDVQTEGRAPLELRGELFFEDDQLVIVCDIRSGRRVRKAFEKVARDVGEIAQVLALTTPLSPEAVSERVKAVQSAFDKPQVEISKAVDSTGKITNSRVSSTAGSQFGLEICIKNEAGEYVPIAAESKDGLAFVKMNIGTIYGVRIFNDTGRQVAVTLTIDGLNLLRFTEEEAHRKFGRVIVLPDRPEGTLIRGWHKSNDECFEFKVGAFAESEAVKLTNQLNVVQQDKDDVGAITAAFAFVAAENEELPADEKIVDRRVGTVRGEVIPAKYRNTKVGKVGIIREVVSVRYDPT